MPFPRVRYFPLFMLYILPGGALDGTPMPVKDDVLRRPYRPGQPLSLGTSSMKSEAEWNAEGVGWRTVSASDKYSDGYGERLRPKRIWDEATQDFVIDTTKGSITRDEFIDRFTDVEREDLFTEAAEGSPQVRGKIRAFFEYIKIREDVNLDSSYIQAAVNQMESQGLIGAGRAAEILAGDPIP